MLLPRLMDLYASCVDADSRAAWTLELGHLPSGWPILKDQEFFVAEGNTILRYIASKLDPTRTLYPKALESRTRVDMFLDWSSQHLTPATTAVLEIGTSYSPTTYQFVSEKRYQPTVDEIGSAMKGYIEVLREMEKLFLQKTAFLAGDEITIADIQAACQLMFSRVFNIDFSPYPQLNVWYGTIQKKLKGWDVAHAEFETFVVECVKQQKMNQAHDQKMKKHGKDAAGGNRQPDIYHTVYFQKPPTEVWMMFVQPEQWAGAKSEFTEKPGGKFAYHETVEGTNLYIQANHRLLQSWRHADWPAGSSSTVRINVEPEGQNGTQLILLQQDVPRACIKKTDELWNAQFWKPMGGVLVRNILQQIFFDNLSPHTVYSLMTDSQACSRLTKTKCDIGRGIGTNVSLLDGTLTGKNVDLVTDAKVVQQIQFSVEGWPAGHYSTLTLEISRVAGGTTVVHTQENVPVGNFRQIAELWEKSFWKKMQRWTEDVVV